MCIDSSSVKNQDLSPYRDFWNGMERNNTDLAVSCVKHSPSVIINPYPITPETSARIILSKFSRGCKDCGSAGGL